MGIPWDEAGINCYEVRWDGTYKYVPWTILEWASLKQRPTVKTLFYIEKLIHCYAIGENVLLCNALNPLTVLKIFVELVFASNILYEKHLFRVVDTRFL